MKTETEVWKDIKGYEGLYQVSNLGRVKRLERWVSCVDGRERCYPEKIVTQTLQSRGYYQCNLNDAGGANRKARLIHRLIAEAFVPNPENYPEVDHIDRDSTNNDLSNLRWATKQQQQWNTAAESTYGGKETTSKYKGVSYKPTTRNRYKAGSRAAANSNGWYITHRKKPWSAVIMIKGKNKSIGMFHTENEAAEAYNQKAKEIHGEFAVLNKVCESNQK